MSAPICCSCSKEMVLFRGYAAELLYLAFGENPVPETQVGEIDFLLLAVVFVLIDKEEGFLTHLPVVFVYRGAPAYLHAINIDVSEEAVADEDYAVPLPGIDGAVVAKVTGVHSFRYSCRSGRVR